MEKGSCWGRVIITYQGSFKIHSRNTTPLIGIYPKVRSSAFRASLHKNTSVASVQCENMEGKLDGNVAPFQSLLNPAMFFLPRAPQPVFSFEDKSKHILNNNTLHRSLDFCANATLKLGKTEKSQ